ncbi:uncharacterized protein LOC118439528 isoform X2 [Folsomia candida]|nr:uncharacterized protein LOC118439528 isoform X2 [Folsomia candida]
MATLSVKGEHVINLLQPERGLNFIVKSVIYDILDGKEEALYKVCDLEKHKKVFNRTSYIFPFKLKLPPTLQLPPTWESPNGSIEYQINLYYRLSHSEYKLVHPKVFNFYGSYIFPFEMLEGHKEKFNETSFSRDDLVMTVRLPQLNFLRREVISFTLQIKNPKRIPLLKIGAKLVCKHIAICKNIPRKSEETVDTFVAKKVSRSDKFEVKGAFQTGKVKVPSYEGHPTFKIEYCIEVEMTTGGGPLKGEISLIIGTGHVDPSPSAPPPRPRSSSFSLFAMLPRPSAPRRSITGSTFSLSSLHPSLPTYSALPSRQGSILSLETLPPHYDDVEEQSFLESDKDDG